MIQTYARQDYQKGHNFLGKIQQIYIYTKDYSDLNKYSQYTGKYFDLARKQESFLQLCFIKIVDTVSPFKNKMK